MSFCWGPIFPAKKRGLKFAIDVFGSEASELVPSYLLLAEALSKTSVFFFFVLES